MKYYMWGLQRSGTNFLEQIVMKNLRGQRCNRQHNCWKHSVDRPKDFDGSVISIMIYKNPYTWVESLCFRNSVDWVKRQTKYPVLAGKNGDPLRAGPRQLNVASLAKTYRDWHITWTQTDIPNRQIVVYEDLIDSTKRQEVLNKLATTFKRTPNKWIIPERGKVSQSKDYNEQREKYYTSMVPKKLTKMQIDAITDIVTPKLLEKIGYKPHIL